MEERWPDGDYPCPKDVKYTELNELSRIAASKILLGKSDVDHNPALLKRIKKQVQIYLLAIFFSLCVCLCDDIKSRTETRTLALHRRKFAKHSFALS